MCVLALLCLTALLVRGAELQADVVVGVMTRAQNTERRTSMRHATARLEQIHPHIRGRTLWRFLLGTTMNTALSRGVQREAGTHGDILLTNGSDTDGFVAGGPLSSAERNGTLHFE